MTWSLFFQIAGLWSLFVLSVGFLIVLYMNEK